VFNSIVRNRSRLPDPTRLQGAKDVNPFISYIDDLVKTLRLRLETNEAELDFQNTRTRTVTTTTDFEADFGNFIILVDAAAGAVTVTLPSASRVFEIQGVYIVREISGSNVVTLTTQSGDLIEGAASVPIAAGESVTVTTDGDDWWLLSNYS